MLIAEFMKLFENQIGLRKVAKMSEFQRFIKWESVSRARPLFSLTVGLYGYGSCYGIFVLSAFYIDYFIPMWQGSIILI